SPVVTSRRESRVAITRAWTIPLTSGPTRGATSAKKPSRTLAANGTMFPRRLVGSHSTKSNTFQWAWQTFDEGARGARDVSQLRVFGEVRGIPNLTTANWACEEAEGWEMAALAGYVLGTEAIYRAPFDHQRWFMLLSNLRHSS